MRRTFVAVVCAIALLTSASSASAHVRRFNVSVTATGGFESVTGQVTSLRPRCVAARTVQLFRGTDTTQTVPYATGQTNPDGTYSFNPIDQDNFFVKAPKFVFKKTSAHKHLCRAATSDIVYVMS